MDAIECLKSLAQQAFSNAKNNEQLQVYKKYYKLVSQELKVLEIMKRVAEKELIYLDDGSFHEDGKYTIYDDELYHHIYITKKEYNLLKKVGFKDVY